MVKSMFLHTFSTNYNSVQTCCRQRLVLLAPLLGPAFRLVSTQPHQGNAILFLVKPRLRDAEQGDGKKYVLTYIQQKLQLGPNLFQAATCPSSSTSSARCPTYYQKPTEMRNYTCLVDYSSQKQQTNPGLLYCSSQMQSNIASSLASSTTVSGSNKLGEAASYQPKCFGRALSAVSRWIFKRISMRVACAQPRRC